VESFSVWPPAVDNRLGSHPTRDAAIVTTRDGFFVGFGYARMPKLSRMPLGIGILGGLVRVDPR